MAILTTYITYKGQTGDLSSKIFFEPILQAPELTSLGFAVREDVVSSEDMYTLHPSDKKTKKKVSCGWNPSGAIADLRDKKITVQEMAIELEECAKDFDGKILQIAKKLGVNRNELTGTELERIMVEIIKGTATRDMMRILWLGDTANASADYNQIDGIWKKVFAGVAGGTINRVSTLADNAMAAAGAGETLLAELYYNAPLELQTIADADKRFYVTRSIYNNYKRSLSGRDLESSLTTLQNGVQALTYQGVPVISLDIVDQYLLADFAPLGDIESPHRAIYTMPENITVGTDQVSDFNTVDFWYEKKEQQNLARVEYKLGVALGWDKYFTVAY